VEEEMAKDKRGDFRRLAERRTIATLDMIRKLENLSNRANYDYTEEEVAKVFGRLTDAIDEARAKFAKNNRKPEFRF
jgi:hypothetical protein